MGPAPETTWGHAPFCPVYPKLERPIFPIFFGRKVYKPRAGLRTYLKKSTLQKPISPSRQQEVLEKERVLLKEPCLSYEVFSNGGQKQMSLFIELGARLNPLAFTASELKYEYRRLLKCYHPDLNKAKTAAQSLNQVVTLYRGLCLEIKSHTVRVKSNDSRVSK